MIGDSRLGIRDLGDDPISNFESRISCLIQTQAQIPENNNWLSEEERKVCARFRVAKRRNDWLLGRWTAKQAIVSFQPDTYSTLSSLEIRAAQDGAPEPFFGGKPAPVNISISHSKDRALCALAPGDVPVGCDLEWIEPREANFAADYFTREEMSFVRKAPVERALAETLIWSAKETTLKILRKGLTRDTRSVLIRAECSGSPKSWKSWAGECLESLRVFHGWWRAADGFVYTLALDR
jgi:4'-phosphopantetheinyl transferase